MILPLFRKLTGGENQKPERTEVDPPLPYSWILTSRLAIGPMPRRPGHWQQLEDAGFRSRFSCCYPDEEIFPAPPSHWRSGGVALPDHREQEVLGQPTLALALKTAHTLLQDGSPLYLHCWAGRERSSLLAVGLVALERRGDVFEALEWVRRCHPNATPIYGHLEVLEQMFKKYQRSSQRNK